MKHNEYILHSSSVFQTQELSMSIANKLKAGDLITLRGDLGAGKTTFTQGLAKGLGVSRHVNSPTFTIIKEYTGEHVPFYHMDAYRLEDEMEALGFEEYFHGQGVCVIEWPEQIESQLPQDRLEITIKRTGDEERDIFLHPVGERYEQLVKEVMV